MNSYTIFDSKAQAFNRPFFSENDETAKREIIIALANPQAGFSFPEDYTLFWCGEFDMQTGTYTHTKTPYSIGNLAVLKSALTVVADNTDDEKKEKKS